MTGTSWKREQRPVLDLPRSSFEIVGELLALVGVIVTVAILLYAWPDLPDRVPTHFGVTGEPDSWGRKATVLFPPLVMMVLYTGLTILNRFPHAFNYPRVITEENAPRQYGLARTLMTWLKAELTWLFAYLEWSIVGWRRVRQRVSASPFCRSYSSSCSARSVSTSGPQRGRRKPGG